MINRAISIGLEDDYKRKVFSTVQTKNIICKYIHGKLIRKVLGMIGRPLSYPMGRKWLRRNNYRKC